MDNYLFVRFEKFVYLGKYLKKKNCKVYFLTNFLIDYIYINQVTKIVNLKLTKKRIAKTSNLDKKLKTLRIRDFEKMNWQKYRKKIEIINDKISEILIEKKISHIFIHNGHNWLDQLVINEAKKKDIKIIYFEEGFFRPNSISVDMKGINYASSIKKKWEKYEELIKFDILDKEYRKIKIKKRTRIFKIMRVLEDNILSFYYPKTYLHNSLLQYIGVFLQRSKIKRIKLELENYILVPFQVHDDTQIKFNSHKIKNMYELVNIIIKAVDYLNYNFEKKLKVVFKEHPKDIGRISYESMKEKYKLRDDIIFLQQEKIEDLIKNSRLVICINSTVGIEAISRYKNVVTLGEAFYNIEDIVIQNKDLNNLSEDIKQALEKPVNKEKIKKFIYFLEAYCNINGSFDDESNYTFQEIEKRLKVEEKNNGF